ncbi:MAG: DUF2306 domain-containing protein [Caulobacteraceae bacterium]
MNHPLQMRTFGFWTMAVLSAAIALVSYRYLIPGAPGAAPAILANRFTHLGALTAHAGFAATALLLGPFQFLAGLRARRPAIHRRMGTIYVICCFAAGTAGLVLAAGTTAGKVAGLGFGLLALAWIAATANAWRLARRRDFTRHRRWMIRSFALCLAAVTLRIYLPISALGGMPYAVAYPVIAWLCWVPNLLIAELALLFFVRQAAHPTAAPPLASGR